MNAFKLIGGANVRFKLGCRVLRLHAAILQSNRKKIVPMLALGLINDDSFASPVMGCFGRVYGNTLLVLYMLFICIDGIMGLIFQENGLCMRKLFSRIPLSLMKIGWTMQRRSQSSSADDILCLGWPKMVRVCILGGRLNVAWPSKCLALSILYF
ncbi:hypothetical protein KP509_29G064700 [Ceratopteris richardii]|uniref:Uncharacterized protein n=1 Tax=Ceratopteris richardii TaxID=49495 RepID=A0A8T2RA48_CERRI|nr:hypothetical protein KP509_29G064700 [Ceratopteris richardii]